MEDRKNSKTVKAGSITYFFDLKKTRDGNPFLVITESRYRGEGKERERSSTVLFPEHASKFLESLQEMIQKLPG